MPSLRDRPGDIALLADHFLDLFAAEDGYAKRALTREALESAETYTFRQCARIEEHDRARAHRERGRIDSNRRTCASFNAPDPYFPGPAAEPRSEPALNLEAAEQALIHRALQETAGNVMEAARAAGCESQPHLPEISQL